MNKIIIVNRLLRLAEELFKESKFYDADNQTEYFVNPMLQELDSIPSGVVRFIADDTSKKVYAWDGYKRLHKEAILFLGLSMNILNVFTSKYLLGTAKKQGSKYIMIISDLMWGIIDSVQNRTVGYEKNKKILNQIVNKDWSWLEDYNISVNSYLDDLKSKLI